MFIEYSDIFKFISLLFYLKRREWSYRVKLPETPEPVSRWRSIWQPLPRNRSTMHQSRHYYQKLTQS